ncbi:MAG: DUF192 domain-containing protein [Treponema sp.]
MPLLFTDLSALRPLKALMRLFCILLTVTATLSCTKSTLFVSLRITSQKTGAVISISAETAVTPSEQQHGFMYREQIADGTGMIFIYGRDRKLSFWMKNTPHPLSIAFIDSQGRIREIRDMQPFSLETVSSTHSVRYALEVPQGYFERAGISAGDMLTTETLHLLQQRYAESGGF